jgi:uncharacterized short protein YbdD (DUF466 family)
MSRWMRSVADVGMQSLPARWGRGALSLLARWARASVRTARLAIGIPDYGNYVDHMHRSHPGRAPMTREEFFRERMLARYGKGRSRCC